MAPQHPTKQPANPFMASSSSISPPSPRAIPSTPTSISTSTTDPTTPSSRWLALTTRLPSAHALFVYSVLTTRIYCRPTCPSRLARRANVIFHNTAAEAAAAGFRPCKRCKPEVEGWQAGGEVVARAKEMMREGRSGLGELSKGVGMSRSHFLRVFKGVVGCTPREWVEGKGRRMGGEGMGDEMRMEGTAGEIGASSLGMCEEGIGGLEEGLPGVEPCATDAWLLDMPATSSPASEDESVGMTSGGERWDHYLNNLSLALQYDFALGSGSLGVSDASTPAAVELRTPSEYIADVDTPVELSAPLKQGLPDDQDSWWQPPALDWDMGMGATLLDKNITMIGFEPLGWSHDWELGLYVDGGSRRL
ncbi:hypothetical protein MMC15_004882 [Xylographa vitiligo]|nr:hypothetical protein [Xylographa vitiligo]